MSLVSPLCRVGRKKSLQSKIKSIAPKNYTKYVEPFVGSGDIFFHLNIDNDTPVVINDLDKNIITAFRILKSNPNIDNINKFKGMSLEQVRAFVKQNHTNPVDKLASIIYDLCATFGGAAQGGKIYHSPNVEPKLRKIPKYAEYMKNTKILNQDYKSVIRSNDSPTTFFYLDPPYESSKKIYEKDKINYDEMANILSKVKGKFVLSLNDSANIRNIFKQFKVSSVTAGGSNNKMGPGANIRKELIIKNF
jgi:DNA adenine methylase